VGRVVDPETGLLYLRARYYDPATGQFLTRDPLEALTGQPYAYAADNPLNGADPLGLFWGEGTLRKVGHFIAQHKQDILTAATLVAYASCPETGVGCAVATALSFTSAALATRDAAAACGADASSGTCAVGVLTAGLSVASLGSSLVALQGAHFAASTIRTDAAVIGAGANGLAWLLGKGADYLSGEPAWGATSQAAEFSCNA
jgi:RHS repeat-associated protein